MGGSGRLRGGLGIFENSEGWGRSVGVAWAGGDHNSMRGLEGFFYILVVNVLLPCPSKTRVYQLV